MLWYLYVVRSRQVLMHSSVKFVEVSTRMSNKDDNPLLMSSVRDQLGLSIPSVVIKCSIASSHKSDKYHHSSKKKRIFRHSRGDRPAGCHRNAKKILHLKNRPCKLRQ